jgi:hypothetical protein
LSTAVRAVAEQAVLKPLDQQLSAHREFCAALATAAGDRLSR